MKKRLTPIVFAIGVCLAVAGGWWVWTGLDIVTVERGWSAVIAGATMLSAGLVIVAMAAVMSKLDEFARASRGEREAAQPVAQAPVAKTVGAGAQAKPVIVPRPERPPVSAPPTEAKSAAIPSADKPTGPAVAPTSPLAGGRETVGQHVSGDTTYIMFADGTVEAHTPEGIVSFPSLDALRAHAEEREADGFRPDRRL